MTFQHLQIGFLAIILAVVHGQNNDEIYREWVDDYNYGLDGAIDLCNKQSLTNWNVQTNVEFYIDNNQC